MEGNWHLQSASPYMLSWNVQSGLWGWGQDSPRYRWRVWVRFRGMKWLAHTPALKKQWDKTKGGAGCRVSPLSKLSSRPPSSWLGTKELFPASDPHAFYLLKHLEDFPAYHWFTNMSSPTGGPLMTCEIPIPIIMCRTNEKWMSERAGPGFISWNCHFSVEAVDSERPGFPCPGLDLTTQVSEPLVGLCLEEDFTGLSPASSLLPTRRWALPSPPSPLNLTLPFVPFPQGLAKWLKLLWPTCPFWSVDGHCEWNVPPLCGNLYFNKELLNTQRLSSAE